MSTEQQKPNISNGTVISVLVLVALFAGLVAIVVWQRQGVPTNDQLAKQTRLKNLGDLNLANQKILTQYHWVDRKKGVVGLPIDQAMKLALVELQNSKPHPAGPIKPAAPAPAAKPAPGAKPAPAQQPAGSKPPAQAQPAAPAQPPPAPKPAT